MRAARSTGGRLKAAIGLRPLQPFKPELPRNAEPRTGMSMGEHAAITAERWGVTREDQDELALDSHRKLAAAYDSGFFDDLVTPHLGLTRDQNLRPDSSLEKLAALKPIFGTTMTAGNSTPLTDGAALVLLANEEWAAEHKLPVQAHFVDRADRRGRLRPRRPANRGPADGPGLRGAAAAGPARLEAAGLRLLRDPRGVRLAGARHARRVGSQRPGHDRPQPPQRARLLAGGRATPSPPPAAG